MDIKTQTTRSTQFKEKIVNFNCWVNDNFEIGVVTSNYWGDFDDREEPLIELEVEHIKYNIPLNEFKKFVKNNLKKWEDWD